MTFWCRPNPKIFQSQKVSLISNGLGWPEVKWKFIFGGSEDFYSENDFVLSINTFVSLDGFRTLLDISGDAFVKIRFSNSVKNMSKNGKTLMWTMQRLNLSQSIDLCSNQKAETFQLQISKSSKSDFVSVSLLVCVCVLSFVFPQFCRYSFSHFVDYCLLGLRVFILFYSARFCKKKKNAKGDWANWHFVQIFQRKKINIFLERKVMANKSNLKWNFNFTLSNKVQKKMNRKNLNPVDLFSVPFALSHFIRQTFNYINLSSRRQSRNEEKINGKLCISSNRISAIKAWAGNGRGKIITKNNFISSTKTFYS